jgi:hypothetical protein
MFRSGTAVAVVVVFMGFARLGGPVRSAEPDAADPLEFAPQPATIDAPAPEALEAAISRGIGFLLAEQRENGSWGSATQTKDLNIYAPIPGAHHAFQTAVTAMCITALYEAGGNRPDVRAALNRAEDWLLAHLPEVRRATGDAMYNVWTHGYSIQALLRMRGHRGDDTARRQRIDELMQMQFKRLEDYESVDGGWGYYDFRYQTKQPSSDSISFVNAAVLVAFHEARQAGYEPPQRLIDRALAATRRQQLEDFSYLYGEYLKWQPRRGINRPGGSLGRSQACNVALRLWGDKAITDKVLTEWLDRLILRNGWLDIGRKRPIPHEAWFQVAGYFYYFGHYYAAWSIAQLPEGVRPFYQAHLAGLILDRQERDGSWWDYPLYDYHQPYGTAFALMTLARCRAAEQVLLPPARLPE